MQLTSGAYVYLLQVVSGTANLRVAARPKCKACPKPKTCPKPKACPRPKACPKPKTCPRCSGITCANFRSFPSCKPYNSMTLDVTKKRAPGRFSQQLTSKLFGNTTYNTDSFPNFYVLNGLAVVVSAVVTDPDLKLSYATTEAVFMDSAGCKFEDTGPVSETGERYAKIVNNVLVWDVTFSCSGKYLVAPAAK
jgi:hypothetical protein